MIPCTRQPLLHRASQLQAGKDSESQTLRSPYGITLMFPQASRLSLAGNSWDQAGTTPQGSRAGTFLWEVK